MTTAVHPEQLQLDLDALVACVVELRDRRRRPTGGAERLLIALVRRGLDEDALLAAAALVAELDRPACEGHTNGRDAAREEQDE